ncbi:MAG: type I methionyl aminopeptidase [Patescibacteria group bacterium]
MSLLTLAEEIAALREGGRRLATYVREVGATIKPGITTRELNDHFERLVRAGNDEPSFLNYAPRGAKRPFPAAICISVNDEVVHGIPTENSRVIMDGDIVTLDGGVTHQGLITDHAVSFIAGIPDEEAVALLQTTERGLLAGVAAAKIGNHVGDISAAVEAVGVEEGYGIVYELGGHGVGYHVHEEPYIPNVGDGGTGEELVEGMVLAIEPMFTEGTPEVKLMKDGYTFVTADGSRAAHFEHTILITKDGPEIVTKV